MLTPLIRRAAASAGRGLLVCVFLACSVTGCAGDTAAESNDRLNSLVLEAATGGTELKLADATDFDWDEAGFITEGTPAEDIEAAFGEAVTRENRYTASPTLFIFLKDGKVAKAIRILPDAFFGGDAKKKYGRDVVLAPLEGQTGFLSWRG
ncbi:hypothetical protein [Arthrobacter oryzae]|uniref:hypothetical protein n=1 Tax=Arthrobacter oryzae TaxID=409290 RepID=UPI00285616AE|nr:hypothetical protein [Arthrobacter oryzae]MDR6506992.1 hypothetical protein [Arthrobacter oryzae]